MTTTATAKITYRKTKSGEWVAFGPADALRSGDTVSVAKRDGTTKVETIASVGKPFEVNGRPMAYGYLVKRSAPVRDNWGRGVSWADKVSLIDGDM